MGPLTLPAYAQAIAAPAPITATASTEPTKPAEVTVWYGWETLALDVTSGLMAVGTLGATDAADIVGLLGIGTYVLGTPIIHLARGHYWRSAGSLAMRLAIPTLGFFIGATIGEHSPGVSNDASLPLADGVIGAGLAMLVPVPIDAFVLGYDTAPAEPDVGAPGAAAWDLRPQPIVVRDARGSRCPGVGLGATF